MLTDTLSSRARDWSLWLTRQPSVTGSAGEQALPGLLREKITATPALHEATCWLIEAEGDPLDRACLAVLVRGSGRETVLLTGHFDTVSVADYGDLAALATEPEALTAALLARLAEPVTPAEHRAKADLESGDFLPGRGLLDMKSGLGAGLAALEAFATMPERAGNLLFVAVPDEEVNSVGARALADALPQLQRDHDIELVAAINLDAIADDGDGSLGRAIALGSTGKLLLTAFVVGQPSHACYPFSGVNAAALCAALAQEMEWNPALADKAQGQTGMPPTLLSLKDGKAGYDVTTPETAFAIWNALSLGRGAEETFATFRALVDAATERFAEQLAERQQAVMGNVETALLQKAMVIEAATLFGLARSDPAMATTLESLAQKLATDGHSLHEQCRQLTEAAWRQSGLRGPAVVIGLGSLPYPAVALGDDRQSARLRDELEAARDRAVSRTGQSIRIEAFFQGISDMSFLGQANFADVHFIAANTPAWLSGVRWSGQVCNLPTINIGPWGRDYHTPLERLHTPYAFNVLPGLVLETALGVLGKQAQ
ncbi:MAG: M20/M25/M40 family metallo-hydrolase [Bosea sp. (in: a-proteobacteria)]